MWLASLIILAQVATPIPCMNKDMFLRGLWEQFHEEKIAEGKVNKELKLVLTLSREGSWSLLRVHDQTACLVASGEEWKFNRGI